MGSFPIDRDAKRMWFMLVNCSITRYVNFLHVLSMAVKFGKVDKQREEKGEFS